MGEQTKNLGGIIYSTYTDANRSGEQFIREHHLAYIISGSLSIIDGGRTDVFNAGEIALLRKNNLGKFIKQPAKGGQFTAITIRLDNETLVNVSKGQQLVEEVYASSQAVLPIGPDILLTNYFHSLLPYFEEVLTDDLVYYKKQEAILLLLRCNPSLKNILFDFGVPGKINLEEFMNRNFRYNVSLGKFAYLTGRSLASFKRDFEKIFNTSPNRWIQQRRLKEAHYLIREKKQKPSDVYLEVGFESLSHFSYSFKQFFGKNPSSL